jgi:hypothetical protein
MTAGNLHQYGIAQGLQQQRRSSKQPLAFGGGQDVSQFPLAI